MLRFLLTRFSLVIPTFIGMTLVAFFLIRMVPGDPIETLAGERGIDATRHALLLKEYGLDRPVLVQYGIYIGRVLQGDLGKSIITHEPVLSEFTSLFPATIELAVSAILFALLLAAFAPLIAPYAPDLTNSSVFLSPPAWQQGGSSAHWLGTDAIGRDILSRLIHGARLSLAIGLAVVALSVVMGTVLGLTAGYFRGVFEVAVMRLMDIILTLPSLLLAIVIVAILGPGLMNAMLAVAIVVLPHYVRITRAAVITEMAKDYVTVTCGSCSTRCCPTARRR